MSTSLGRLTLELAADPTQLNNDLNAVKAHSLQVAKDIEQALKNAFKSAGQGIPSPTGGGGNNNNNPFGGLGQSVTNFANNIRNTFNSLKGINLNNLFGNLKSSFQNIPNLAKSSLANLPNILKAGVKGLPLVLAAVGVEAGKKLGSSVMSAAKLGLNGLKSIAQKAGEGFKQALSSISFGAFAAAGASAFEKVTGLIGGAIDKVKEFGSGLFDTLREVQKFDAQLKTFVADDKKRADLNKRLNEFSATTPFELKDVRKSAISALSTMPDPSKLNIDKYMADLKALGDVAAGAQQPVGELADKFAKARSEGRAQNEDLAEWAGRGIPIYQELGKILGATTAEVRQMATDGKINFEELNQAIQSMTQQGGVYFKAMENQSKTLEGKLSNISDTFYQFKENLGKAFEPLANLGVDIFGEMVSGLSDSKGVMADITKETQKLADYFKQNPEIAKALNKSLQDIVKGAMKGLVNGVKTFVEFLKDNPAIIKQIASGIATVTKTLGKAVDFVVDIGVAFGGAVINQVKKNSDLIFGFLDTVKDVVKVAIEVAAVFGEAVFDALNKNNFLVDALRSVTESIIGLWNDNKEAIVLVGKALGELVATVLKTIIDLVVGILNYLKEHPAIIQAIATGIQLVAKVFEGVVLAVGKILEGIGWIVEKITVWAKTNEPVQNFFNSVGNAVNGIIGGMDGIINKTFDWLKRLEPVARALEWISNQGNQSAETGVNNITNAAQGMMGGSGKGSDGVYWGKAGQYKSSDLSGLTDRGRKALEALKNPNVRAFLDAVAASELGNEAAAKGGYGYLFGDDVKGGKESFDPNNLSAHPRKRVPFGHTASSATGRYQTMDFVWDEEHGRLGLKDMRPESQEIMAVSRLMYRGILDQIMKGDVSGALKKAGTEWASIEGNPYGQGTATGKRSVFLSNYQKALQQAQATPTGSSNSGMYNVSEPSFTNSGKAIQSTPLTITDSSTGENITNYNQVSVHHKNMRGGGRGRQGNRSYAASDTHSGQLEELGQARVTGRTVGNLITKDFVLSKNGNKAIPSPSPASGIVAGVIPSIGAVEIMNEQGQTIATSMHLKNIRVKKGDRVSYGQTIGTQAGVGGYPVHTHVELPEANFKQFISDIKSGRFGSVETPNVQQIPQFDESGVGGNRESFDQAMAKGSSYSGGSNTSPSSSAPTSSTKPSSTPKASAQAQRDLQTARQKQNEQLYKEISEEIKFSQRKEDAAQKQQRELEDQKRKREQEDSKARLQLQAAKAESPEAKKELESQLARFDVDSKYSDELLKLQRQREDLVQSRDNKTKALAEAKKRKEEFIAQKKAAGEDYTEADLKKFDVSPDEGSMMDFTKAIKSIDKMIEAQKQLKDLELQTLGISESVEDKKARQAKQRERDIEQIKREGATEIDNYKKLAAVATDPEVKKAFEDKAQKRQIEIDAKINLMPIDDQLEDLQKGLKELMDAGLKSDNPKVQEIQKQITELNNQKQEIARKSGVDLSVLENERKQAQNQRDREKEAQNRELEHKNKISELDQKLASASSDTEKAQLEFEKQKLELLKQQNDEQKPLLNRLSDLQNDRKTLIDSGRVKEGSDEIKILDDAIGNVNKQLEVTKATSETAMQTLAKESEKAIEEAKRADAGRLIEKESMLSGADVRSARIERMKARNADPYKISAMERESALAEEALRYRQEMLAVEEKIASLKGTNAELTADEANTLRNNAAAMHEMNIEGINENVKTLGKDLTDIGKGALSDFFGQLKSGSMDFKSILNGIIDSLWNLAQQLIQSELFGEDGIFGKKSKKKDDSGGNWIDGLFGEGSSKSGSFLGAGAGMGATPMQPAYVSVVGGAGGMDSLFGGAGTSGTGTDFVSSIFGGNASFNKANPLPIDMVSASKDAFSGLGDIFSGLFGGGGNGFGGGIANLVGGIFGGGSSGGGGGGFAGGLLSFLPNLLGFSEGGRVEGVSVGKIPLNQSPIAKALKAEKIASGGKKPVLAVLHENELVLNEEQQKRMGIFDVPRFDSGGVVGGTMNNFNKKNETTINMSFNGGDGSDTNGLDANALRAVINQEIIRQQGSGGSLGRGSYSRRGR